MLDYLDYGQVNAVGVSWGGALAQQFAYDYPERCKKLVLAATAAGAFMVPGKPKVLWMMASPRRYVQPSHVMRIAPLIYGGSFRRDPSLAAEHAAKVCAWPASWLLLAAVRGPGLDQHSLAPQDPSADPGAGRR